MLKGRRTTYSSGGVRRLIFTGNTKTTLFNKYNHGSGVGALNASVRRALLRRAANKSCKSCQVAQSSTPTPAPPAPPGPS